MKQQLSYSITAFPSLSVFRILFVITLAGIFTIPLQAANLGYDAAGRVVWSIQPGGQTTTFSYDANGNINAIASITPGEDSDLDGIPDYFEILFSGTATGLNASDDPDGDGNTQLVEYAFGLNPSVPDGSAIAPIGITPPDPMTGDRFFTLTYLRPQSGTLHLSYTTRISFDLKDPWITAPSEVLDVVVEPMDGGLEEVSVRFLPPVGSSELLFMRVRIETL